MPPVWVVVNDLLLINEHILAGFCGADSNLYTDNVYPYDWQEHLQGGPALVIFALLYLHTNWKPKINNYDYLGR